MVGGSECGRWQQGLVESRIGLMATCSTWCPVQLRLAALCSFTCPLLVVVMTDTRCTIRRSAADGPNAMQTRRSRHDPFRQNPNGTRVESSVGHCQHCREFTGHSCATQRRNRQVICHDTAVESCAARGGKVECSINKLHVFAQFREATSDDTGQRR
ncbi:hypothetical protein BC567DRAFT_236111 [Phyllosticta citribraziliensis]